MALNTFSDLEDKLAVWLDELPEDVEAQKDNKRQDDTIANLLNEVKNITCSHLKYEDMTDLELDDNIMKKIW
ncbi:uncharacterized protein CIMG_12957 [Coccidioides immitis RS]|uniref:Uncharacterized protein n=1 Tax=Coccidioides immitis (strain RS) TaxID=246410 RepID=A0A0D8JTY1_COCIM|nr:uncharacterized protein CIMG_12957 [Coccidioides immitis RS]KJF60421.1 hypothetical protein CIMG_12957 [Coccidioides immitis RS]